jgi:spectinomycin phosphotransferase
MLEKLDLAEDRIIACLRDSYGVTATDLEFLPIGNDSAAWVYRVGSDTAEDFFLKVRKGPVDANSLVVPRYLKDSGVTDVVAPLSPVVAGPPWGTIDDYTLILYPFVVGRSAAELGFSEPQWVEYGAIFRKIHATPLSEAILGLVPRETFVSSWGQGVQRLQATLDASEDPDPRARELAAIWTARRDEINRIVERMEKFGPSIQARQLEFVLCHTDLHLANVLIDPEGRLLAVDWDMPLLAPKERDLHFVIQSKIVRRFPIGPREEELIFRGYGPTAVDWPALVYFRCEWVCGDLYEYGEAALGNREGGDADRDDAIRITGGMFQPGNSVATIDELIQRAPPGTLPPI